MVAAMNECHAVTSTGGKVELGFQESTNSYAIMLVGENF